MDTISFARGVPAPECLPVEELADCARGRARARRQDDPLVRLRRRLHAAARADRGVVRRRTRRVVLTNGALQGFVLLAQRFARGQTRARSRSPTYDRALKILRESGASLATRPARRRGHRARGARGRDARRPRRRRSSTRSRPSRTRAAARCRPSAARADRRARAAATNLPIVEDDPYGLIRFEGEAPPALFDLSGKTTIYSSSFSKTIAPGLRVGWYILPEELAGELDRGRGLDLHHARAARPGDRATSSSAAAASSRTSCA